MSDLFCTTVMCSQGKASVETMRHTFDTLSNEINFDRYHYESAVSAIEQAFQDNYGMFSQWIPFNPACCAIKDLGLQAEHLTADMLQSMRMAGTGPGPSNTPPVIDSGSLITLGMLALGAVIVSNVAPLMRRSR